MKKFIFTIVIFGIWLLGLAFAADIVITSGLMKTGDSRGKGYDEFTTWNAICSSSIDAEVIINGSSRAYRHINPFILDTILNVSAYNIGMSGASFDKQYVRYLTLEKYNRKPKYIIQSVDYQTLLLSNSVDDRILPYIPFIEKKKYLKGVTKFMSFIPFYRYYKRDKLIIRGLIEFFHIKHYPDARKKGFFESDMSWNGSAFNKILQKDSLVACKDSDAITLFDQYLKHCKKNNIQVIFVFTPQYYKMTDFTKDKKEVTDVYKSFTEKYGIPFLDYSTDSMCYDTTYFFNAMHLNKLGAKIFSFKLARDIDSLGILKKKFRWQQ